MSALREALGDYLGLRRALGHKLDDAGRQLARFVEYFDDIGAETVSVRDTLAFVLAPGVDPASSNPARRLTAVRGFARYLAGRDGRNEVPPVGLVVYHPKRREPYLFSAEDVGALVTGARASSPFAFRAETLATLFGLLAVTGMRVGEALRLERRDIDWGNAVVLVRGSKFGKGRDVPVSASTTEALAAYADRADRPPGASCRFFVSLAGTPFIYADICQSFHRAVTTAGLGGGSTRPRIHDLRYSNCQQGPARLAPGRPGRRSTPAAPVDLSRAPGAEVHLPVPDCHARAARLRHRQARSLPGGGMVSALAPTLQAFFTDRLTCQRRASPQTVAS